MNLHSAVQQGSSLRWSRPGSHSSPASTLELPHTLLFLSLKHTGALKRNVFPTEIDLAAVGEALREEVDEGWIFTLCSTVKGDAMKLKFLNNKRCVFIPDSKERYFL